jgi:hypothetical protein
MKKQILSILCFCIPLFCLAQNPAPREYWYDDAGNRIVRKVFELLLAPPAPQDTTLTEPTEPQTTHLHPLNPQPAEENSTTADNSPQTSEFFVEKIAQTEIKIYPNPTTEKITLEISNMETLQTGVFKLYSMSGQLLQEQPVHSAATIVSLANLPKGAYILKVQINENIEDWKIIKH